MHDARSVANALGQARRSGDGWVCLCPAHDDHEPSLSVTDFDGSRLLVHCHAGCEQSAVIAKLRSRRLWPGERWRTSDVPSRESPSTPPRRRRTRSADRCRYAMEVWEKGMPIAGTAGEKYFRNRWIRGDLPLSLKYSPSLVHGPTGERHPAILVPVTDRNGNLCAIQRIFIRPDGTGKAPVRSPKLSLGSLKTGAVRLAEATTCIGLCEGVEDGFSAMEMYDVPVWCALGAARLRKLFVPPIVRHVIIFADADEAGLKAAKAAAKALRSRTRRSTIARPERGKDFNEQLLLRERSRCGAS